MFLFLMWLASIAVAILVLVLFIKFALRAITALDLYNHAKNLEIRSRYESINKDSKE